MLAAGLPVGSAAYANEAIELFDQVALNTPALDETQCSYTTIGSFEDGVLEERFTAQAIDAWQLIKVNSTKPGEQAIEDYADGAKQRQRRNHPLAFDLAKLAQMDSLQMPTEDAETATFTFLLRPDEERETRSFSKRCLGRSS